jgi:hypothetical protein
MDKNTKIGLIVYGGFGIILLGLSIWNFVEYKSGDVVLGDIIGPLILTLYVLAIFAFLVWYVKRKRQK